MIKARYGLSPAFAAALFACSVAAVGQGSTAAINGTVKDAQGAIVPGAIVTATQTDTNLSRTVTVTESGEFNLGNLPVGPYSVTVKSPGFSTFTQRGIVLNVGEVAALPVALQIGAEAQTVEVTADISPVETTDNTIQSVISKTIVEGLPLNGRNPADLVNTVAGVTNVSLNIDPTNQQAGVQNFYKQPTATIPSESVISTNGVRPGGTYFTLDGASNVDPYSVIGGVFPNPDATQEFSVVTGSYGAQYISAPGGAVNIVTRSGTNRVHGTVFEFIRNGFFNAQNAVLAIPDPLKRNQYGATLGGPLLRDKLFVFGSYQETDITTSNAVSNFVPTADARNGIFVSTATGKQVVIPAALRSPVSAKLLQYIPMANRANGSFVDSVNTKSRDHQGALKVDWNIGQHRLFARYFGDFYNQPAVGLTGMNAFHRFDGQVRNFYSMAAGDVWSSKSGHWLSSLHFSYVNLDIANLAPSTDATLSASNLGMTGVSNDPLGGGIGVYSTFNISTLNQRSFLPRKSYTGTEDVTRVLGKHEISFGGTYIRNTMDESQSVGRNPAFYFQGTNSQYVYQFGQLNDNATADLILGAPLLYQQDDGFFNTTRANIYGLYAQDKFRITDRLTLIGGLRWDPYLPYTQASGNFSCYRAGSKSTTYTNAPTGLIFATDSGCSNGGTPVKYNIVQPRVGFAYQLDAKGRLALRGGFGEYSVQFPLSAYDAFTTTPFTRYNQLIQVAMQWDNLFPSIALLQPGYTNPFAGGFRDGTYKPASNVAFPSTPINFTSFNPNLQPAITKQYTLSLQQAFTKSDSVEVAYAGTLSTKLSNTADANLPAVSTVQAPINVQAARPNQSFGQIFDVRSDSHGSYNGLQVTFRHINAGNLSGTSAFTWSKCIDEGTQTLQGATVSEFGNNPRLRRGRCDFDQDLTWRNTFVWSLPALQNQNHLVREVAGSWAATGIFILDNGQPFSVLASSNSNSGIGTDLADRVPGVPLYVNGTLNYAAFTQNAFNTYGNSGRNAYRTKRFVDLDFGLQKLFPIHERFNAMFRVETFNIFNHVNYYSINNNFASSTPQTFGKYLAAHDPRIMQFSLKLNF